MSITPTAPGRIRHSWPLRLASFLPYLFLLGTAYSVFAETVDDPYITFRYAANLLAGHGLVFNSGERVEGFTSPLHLLLSALLLSVAPATDILFKAKCASLLFAFIMLAQTRLLAQRTGLNGWECILAQSLVALNINFALAAVNALETTLYGSVLLGALLVFHREIQKGRGLISGALLFLATLARPEAFLVGLALGAVRGYWGQRSRVTSGFVLGWFAAFLVPTLLLEAVRWSYYGQLLPNTYFAKSQSLLASLSGGISYILRATAPTAAADFLHDLSLLHPDNLLAFGSLVQKNLRADMFSLLMSLLFWGLAIYGILRMKLRLSGGMTLVVLAAVLVFVIKAGGDWMYGWRFMAPVLPLLAICQCHAVRALGHRLARRSPVRSFPAKHAAALCGYAVAALWLVSCTKTTHYSWQSAGFSTQGNRLLAASQGYGPLWVKGAEFIHHLPPGTTVAYSEMGYAGYLNLDKYMLDIRGLTDSRIAHLPAQFKYSTGIADKNWYQPGDPLDRILESRKPDLIISFDPAPPRAALIGYRREETLALPTDSAQAPVLAYVFQRVPPRRS